MWLLLSTFSFVVVLIIGQSPEDTTAVSPEIDISEEIFFPENVVTISPEDIELPDSEEFLDSTENPDDEEVQDSIEIPDSTENPDDTEDPDNTENPDDTEDPDDMEFSGPTVLITQGRVEGSFSDDKTYAQFYGIPYADATSGRNRFKAPNPAPTFQDTFVANRRDIKCVRALGTGYEGTEDCLVANIFTSNLNSSRQFPVMVWVKGKEFNKAYEFEPSFKKFIDQDVIIVTLNYRESVLGFLCLGTETAPGNAGLKDIIAGLRWVRENIAEFGGNPNDITLVGHGSGAAAVDLVTLSPMSNGLINKAIAQSGNALSPWAVSRDNVKYAIQVAEALGHIITDIEELSAVFERTSVPALMGVINALDLTDNSLAFAPCLERESLGEIEPFMVKSPYQILVEGNFNRIPFLTGYVDNEGTIRSEQAIRNNWLARMDESFTDFIQPDLIFDNDTNKAQIAQNIRAFYFKNDPIDIDHVENYIHYHGDTMILVSTLREIRLRSLFNPNLYIYQFSYKGSLGEPFVGPLEVNSAAHSEELAYLFYNDTDDISIRDRTIGDILVERWCWFAKTSVPLSSTSTVFWQTYSLNTPNYLRILDNDEINERSTFEIALVNPHPDILTFWDEIYDNYFLDAEGRWDWTERDEDEDEEENESEGEESEDNDGEEDSGEESDGEGDGDGAGEGDGAGGGDGDGAGEGDGEDDNDNSASTSVGYTFSIITLFAILSKIHFAQILS